MFESWKRAAVAGRSSTTWSRPDRLIIIGGLLLIVAIQISAGIILYDARHIKIASKERELKNIALIISDQLNRVFDAVMAMQLNIAAQLHAGEFTSSGDFEQKQSDQGTHLRLKNHAANLPQIGFVALINAQGKLFNSSRFWPAPEDDISNSDFVMELRSNPQIVAVLSRPIRSRTSQTWVVHMARKILGPNGELIGIVTAAIELQYIAKLFERIALTPDSSIAFYQMDGTL